MIKIKNNKDLEQLFKEAKSTKPKKGLSAEQMDTLNEEMFS